MMLEFWKTWITAFDAAAASDDWSALGRFLTEDAVYTVAGVPYACEIRGRDAVIAAFQKSLRGFDRKFDRRFYEAVGIKVWGETAITARAKVRYTLAGAPDVSFSARGAWFFRGGLISVMTDIYDSSEVDLVETLAWLQHYGAGFDPTYT
jgi:ketosteroid isomerase-like protein